MCNCSQRDLDKQFGVFLFTPINAGEICSFAVVVQIASPRFIGTNGWWDWEGDLCYQCDAEKQFNKGQFILTAYDELLWT